VSPDSVLSKTHKGAQEIATRQNKLDPRLRALLIMVNGKATAAELAEKFGHADIAPMLEQLAAQGLIQETGAAAPAAGGGDGLKRAQLEICSHLREALGADADSLTEKIEACKSAAEVRAYLEARRQIFNQRLGTENSVQFWAKADAALR